MTKEKLNSLLSKSLDIKIIYFLLIINLFCFIPSLEFIFDKVLGTEHSQPISTILPFRVSGDANILAAICTRKKILWKLLTLSLENIMYHAHIHTCIHIQTHSHKCKHMHIYYFWNTHRSQVKYFSQEVLYTKILYFSTAKNCIFLAPTLLWYYIWLQFISTQM